MNPFDALGNFILGKIKEGIWAAWLKILFELIFTMTLAILAITGAALAHGTRAPIALGMGMCGAAGCMLKIYLWERNRLFKGMIVVLPTDVIAALDDNNFQVLSSGTDTKAQPQASSKPIDPAPAGPVTTAPSSPDSSAELRGP